MGLFAQCQREREREIRDESNQNSYIMECVIDGMKIAPKC